LLPPVEGIARMSLLEVLAAATRRSVPRRRFAIGTRAVGSVAIEHLPLLRDLPPGLDVGDEVVQLEVPQAQRDAWFSAANARLREAGAIAGWRDETYAVVDPQTLAPLARIERAASRFWGTLTFGAHANGFVAGDDGRRAKIWLAQRSLRKATDPGLLDNLVGGGVPAGQTPWDALLREGWEEAGLAADVMRGATPGHLLRLHRDMPHGLQNEWLYAYDLQLPPRLTPLNQDGEVAAFQLLPLDEALALAAAGGMAADAAVVMLDFALRHRLLGAAEHEALAAQAGQGLWLPWREPGPARDR
jgi:8-oxo-dGTP pyrophosphatase MutT (NUDIX family)